VVELDGEILGDLPYQERRRLLSGLDSESVRLRVTPSVKMPLGSWFHAWQENGFSRAIAKHANSRYQPGSSNPDWIILDIKPDGAPGVTRLFWKGRKKREITR
jgi:ATP-dependent DNA ligase